jgi:hypothetical protein
MKLSNSFSDRTRQLFAFTWVCWKCGGNGQSSGGLEIHHILGRCSASALNASVLCKECHAHVGHSVEEEQELIAINVQFLGINDYQPIEEDYEFIIKNAKRIFAENKLWPIKEVMKLVYKMLFVNTCLDGDISSGGVTQQECMTVLKKHLEPSQSTQRKVRQISM